MPHLEMINKICKGSDCHDERRYCILSEILQYLGHVYDATTPADENCRGGLDGCVLKDRILATDFSDKTLMQMKCLEMYKWEQSQLESRDVGWDEAFRRWVRRGCADRFSEVYDSKKEPMELYRAAV